MFSSSGERMIRLEGDPLEATDTSVSVIVTTYNSGKYVGKTLNSVLNQSYKNFNIIVVDDGSSDNTIDIISTYGDKCTLLHHENNCNLGQSATLNLGISKTKSPLIAFIDSDDMWHSDKLREQVKTLTEYPDVGLVYTNGSLIDENDNVLCEILPASFMENNKPEDMLLKCYIKSPSAVMVRREVFDKVGLFKTYLFNGKDHDMWIRISEIAKFHYIPQNLYYYRKHPNQISKKRSLWIDGFRILQEACERYPYGFNFKRKRMSVLFYRLAEHDYRNGNYIRAMLNITNVAVLDPIRAIKESGNRIIKWLKTVYNK
jgi:glycosyltransferase involved in cell wall biosynthesis